MPRGDVVDGRADADAKNYADGDPSGFRGFHGGKFGGGRVTSATIDEALTNYRALLRLMAGLRAPRLLPAASGEDNPMAGTRSSSAALTSAEVNSLRRVASGLANFLSSNHRLLLTAMGLIATTGSGHLVLTQEGRERLAEEAAKQPPSARQTNPFETPPNT